MDLSRLSTCTFPLKDRPLDQALPVIAATGYKRIDLLGRMPHFSLDPAECDPAAVLALAQEHGLEIANLGTYVGVGLARDAEAEQAAALEEMKRAIDIAASYGARSIRVFRPHSEIDDPTKIDQIVPWLQQAATHAESKQVYMGFENHGGPLCGDPEQCRILSAKVDSPYFGVLYDPCNLMGAGTDYRAALDIMQDHITHVHFKDGIVDGDGFRRTMLGEGDIDFSWIMGRLDQIGYAGHIATEYELLDPPPETGLQIWYERYQAL
ncbi:MAG TPA: sugar phosphate isomerase/epimerase family protein [Caldilineaceae bacterium]|nr:sugar phosphate isomerase/epimerase family protein [Caldilineaceae bacterium]